MNRETKTKQPERLRENYNRRLEEIANEFRFSDDVLIGYFKINNQNLFDDISIDDEDDDEPKVENGKSK